jgi:hypothetical protein
VTKLHTVMSEVSVMTSSHAIVQHTQYDVWSGYYGNSGCEFVQPHCSYYPMTSSTYYYNHSLVSGSKQQQYNCVMGSWYQGACDVTDSKQHVRAVLASTRAYALPPSLDVRALLERYLLYIYLFVSEKSTNLSHG